MKRTLSLILAIAMMLSLAACGGSGNETTPAAPKESTAAPKESTTPAADAKYAKEITIGTTVKTLDPGDSWNATYEGYQQLVFDSLFYMDKETGEMKLQLAKSAEWVDDTHKQLHVVLRDDIKFSNGDPVTAEDVKFSLDRANVTYINSFYESTDVKSATECFINLKTPSIDFLTYLGWACGSIVCKKEAEAHEKGLALVGSGPYKYDMASLVAESSIDLLTNEYFWGEKTPTEVIHLVKLSDATTAAVALQNGDIDYYQNFGDSNLVALEADKNVEVTRYNSTNFIYMGFNDHKDTTTVTEEEINFRRAVACAINREDIIAGLGGGANMVSMLGYDHPAYIANESDYAHDLSYNLDNAKAYLAKAGGRTKFNCLVDSSRSWCMLAAQVIQEQLRQIGIEMEIEETDGTGFTSQCKWDVYDYDAQIYSNLFVARNSGYNFEQPKVAANRVTMNNPVVNEAIDKMIAASDQDAKDVQWKIIETEVHEYVSFLPLVFREMNYAVSAGTIGVTLTTYGPTWNFRQIARVIG